MAESSPFASRAARVTLVMCALYAFTGVSLPYLGRWLEVERGLTGAEIGAVLSLASLTRIFVGPGIAFWADGVADRRTPLLIVAVAAVAAYAGFFFVARDFPTLLLFGFIALTSTQALVPFVEGAMLRATAEGKLSYGVARGIGSLAFIVANIAGGVLIARFGLGAVVVWLMAAVLTTAASTFLLHRDPAPHADEPRNLAARFADANALVGNRRFLLLIFACGLIQSGHGFYYGFSTLVWRAQGLTPEMVGVLWAFAVAVEVAFLWSLPFLERRISPVAFILLAAIGGVVRWIAMGFAPTGWVLWPLQALHALTFAAAHIGAMRLLYREASERVAGLAQTLYSALSGGVLLGGATLLSGLLYDWGGAQGYWAMAALCVAGGTLALALSSSPTPRPTRSNP